MQHCNLKKMNVFKKISFECWLEIHFKVLKKVICLMDKQNNLQVDIYIYYEYYTARAEIRMQNTRGKKENQIYGYGLVKCLWKRFPQPYFESCDDLSKLGRVEAFSTTEGNGSTDNNKCRYQKNTYWFCFQNLVSSLSRQGFKASKAHS